jgi:hypothetical protein
VFGCIHVHLIRDLHPAVNKYTDLNSIDILKIRKTIFIRLLPVLVLLRFCISATGTAVFFTFQRILQILDICQNSSSITYSGAADESAVTSAECDLRDVSKSFPPAGIFASILSSHVGLVVTL